MAQAPASLKGKTVRWSFDSGPTKGMCFEHHFAEDGSVSYTVVGGDAKPTREERSAVARISDSVHVVSYLGSSGYALTVILNFADGTALSFASNEKEWFPARGTFELLES